jgi:hypothetical protein
MDTIQVGSSPSIFPDAASAALKGNAKRRHRCLHVGQWQATVVTIDIKTAIQS